MDRGVVFVIVASFWKAVEGWIWILVFFGVLLGVLLGIVYVVAYGVYALLGALRAAMDVGLRARWVDVLFGIVAGIAVMFMVLGYYYSASWGAPGP